MSPNAQQSAEQSAEQSIGQSTDSSYRIKNATREELAQIIEWAAEEGWNPGERDAECFYAADPNGFLVGTLAAEPIASISAVKYGGFGFIGFYMVKPAFRGRGYGLQIWEAGLSYLEDCAIGLDGVVQQQNNYAKSGFELAHRNVRYEGKCSAMSLGLRVGDRTAEQVVAEQSVASTAELVPLSSIPFQTVLEYDRSLFLANRADFLKCWIGADRHAAIGLIYQQRLVGYGVLRPCRQGYKIGPLFADSAEFAESIFLALAARVEPERVFYLDVPEPNAAAVALAEKYRMTAVFETARMYRKTQLNLPLSRIFGITSFELG